MGGDITHNLPTAILSMVQNRDCEFQSPRHQYNYKSREENRIKDRSIYAPPVVHLGSSFCAAHGKSTGRATAYVALYNSGS